MAAFKATAAEDAMIAQLKGFVDANNLQGLVEFSNVVSDLANQPEDAHKKFVAATKAYTEYACEKYGSASEDAQKALAPTLINAGDSLVRGTADAARQNMRFKVPLLSCNVHGREMLSMVYELTGRINEAARTLQEMPLDAGLPSHPDEYKFSLWCMLAELNISLGQEIQAENFLNHARPIERSAGIQQGARDRFNYCYARVLDGSKKYVEAANRYFVVSGSVEDQQQALGALRSAVVCATMAEPSIQRNRILGALYSDERRAKLGAIGDVVDKLFQQRVLRKHDIDALTPYLQQQHKAVGVDRKTTEFDLAITRHNVLSASKIYTAITFNDLAALLGNTPAEAERIAAQMAAQGRISATIDQLNECVSFVGNASVPVMRWDSQIDTVGNLIASVAETIVKRHPELEPKGGL